MYPYLLIPGSLLINTNLQMPDDGVELPDVYLPLLKAQGVLSGMPCMTSTYLISMNNIQSHRNIGGNYLVKKTGTVAKKFISIVRECMSSRWRLWLSLADDSEFRVNREESGEESY